MNDFLFQILCKVFPREKSLEGEKNNTLQEVSKEGGLGCGASASLRLLQTLHSQQAGAEYLLGAGLMPSCWEAVWSIWVKELFAKT